jgi:ketosteroid isomerase-like protein
MSPGAVEIRHQVRSFFAMLERKDRDGLAALLHEDVVFAAQIVDGAVLRGRDNVLALFYDDVFSWPIYEAEALRVEPLSSTFALVTGRVRYMKQLGGLADVPVIWLLGMADGQLAHLYGASSRAEALAHMPRSKV